MPLYHQDKLFLQYDFFIVPLLLLFEINKNETS